MTAIDFLNLIRILLIASQVLLVAFVIAMIFYIAEVVYEKREKKVVKEIFDKLEERLAVHTHTTTSEDYMEGAFDTMEWVDSKIEELKKEMVGESDGV